MKQTCAFDDNEEVARLTFADSHLIVCLCSEHRDKALDAVGVKEPTLKQLENEASHRAIIAGQKRGRG